jgi:hypothetical protein
MYGKLYSGRLCFALPTHCLFVQVSYGGTEVRKFAPLLRRFVSRWPSVDHRNWGPSSSNGNGRFGNRGDDWSGTWFGRKGLGVTLAGVGRVAEFGVMGTIENAYDH